MIDIFIDGGARGNPGEAAIGFVIFKDGKELFRNGKKVGNTTNNQAEYLALIEALNYLIEKNINSNIISIFSDSELLVNQINGKYKVKSESLIPLYKKAKSILNNFKNIKVYHISREKNRIADWILNRVLDNKSYRPVDGPQDYNNNPEESPGS